MGDELTKTLAVDVILIPGAGGVFEVEVDGKNIFSKKETNRFPETEEILNLLKNL